MNAAMHENYIRPEVNIRLMLSMLDGKIMVKKINQNITIYFSSIYMWIFNAPTTMLSIFASPFLMFKSLTFDNLFSRLLYTFYSSLILILHWKESRVNILYTQDSESTIKQYFYFFNNLKIIWYCVYQDQKYWSNDDFYWLLQSFRHSYWVSLHHKWAR